MYLPITTPFFTIIGRELESINFIEQFKFFLLPTLILFRHHEKA